MGKTVSVRFKDGKVVPSKSKDPKYRALVQATGEAFLKRPGAVVAVVNPDLPEEAREAAQWLLDKSRVPGFAVGIPHDAKVESIPEWPEKFSREDFEEKRSAKDALYKAEYEGEFAPQTPCSQCGDGMNPAEAMLGPVCGKCCRKNHRAVTRR